MVTFQYRDDAESFMDADISINGRQAMIRWATPREADGFPWPPHAPREFGITYHQFRIPTAPPTSQRSDTFPSKVVPDESLIPDRPPSESSRQFERKLPPPQAPPPGADKFDEMVYRIRTAGLEAFSIDELQQMLRMREQGDDKFAMLAAFIVDKGKGGDDR
jgi:hypothetical protein